MRRLVSLVLVFAIAASAGGYTFNDVAVEYWAGSGSNEAVVVIDFGEGSYAFGYRWDGGPKYGKNLMDAVAAAGSLDYNEAGGFLNTISYDGYSNIGENGWPTDWWSYFVSDDGENWVAADVEFAMRELSNGVWDGWAHQTTGAWPPVHLPTTPTRGLCTGTLDYDSNDFAIEVVEYIEGEGVGNDWLSGQPFNDPNTALGRPTLETTGDGWLIPVDANVPAVPVYQAFRAFELVTVGNGGRLTVKFNHPVANDKNNPYGIDFIIYGNAAQIIGAGSWTNGSPEDVTVGGSVFAEPGFVAVSQDGNDWYYFSSGPYADTFAPTASYEWDDVNDVWDQELDPTRPMDPNLSASDMDGKTVAEVIEMYNGSAGGTGFDIGEVGLDWIMYVRIEDDLNSTATTEIDAIADVSCCGDYKHPYPVGDLNEDCRIDMADFAIFTSHWLECTWKCP